MTAVAAVLAFISTYLPTAISLGAEVAPLIGALKTEWNNFSTANGATQADFDAFAALIKPYEDDLQARADEAARELTSAGIDDTAARVASGTVDTTQLPGEDGTG